MADFEELKERIIKAKLTKKESSIAEYILYNISKVCFMSTSELAKELGTSNTSVNRTAKALGYHVFNDLQKEIQQYVSDQANTSDKFHLPPQQRMINIDTNDYSGENLVTHCFELVSNNLMSVLSKNTTDKFDRVVDILAKSNHRYIGGYRGTATLAYRFEFLLSLIVGNVIIVAGEDINNIEKILDIEANDCMVMISFNRYRMNALEIIKICKERSAKLILITDRATAPFSQYADELLIVDVGSLSFFNSNAAPMFLLELICTMLAVRLDGNAKERLNILEPFINKTQIF